VWSRPLCVDLWSSRWLSGDWRMAGDCLGAWCFGCCVKGGCVDAGFVRGVLRLLF